MTTKEALTANDLVEMIRKRYVANRNGLYQPYVVLEQVPDGIGMHQGHWIDVAVFGLWASKGLTRSAFEIKVSRSDFIHELQTPMKHQWVKESFHEFWFVAPQDVIQIDELPNGSGWMCPRGNKLVIKKHCVRNDNPKLDDVLLAAFMRAASKEIDRLGKVSEEEVLEKSKRYQDLKVFEQAVKLFCEKRGVTVFGGGSYGVDEIVRDLERASGIKEFDQDLYQLAEVTENFQRKVTDLFGIFAVIASESILARKELGEFLISKWGTHEGDALQLFRNNNGDGLHKYQEEYKELVKVIEKMGGK